MEPQLLMMLPNASAEELMFIKNLTKEMNQEEQMQFLTFYQGRRKDQQTIIILTCLGFVGVSGIQRFIIGQVGMGILFLFTGGLCMIGTIVDLVNAQKLANEYNQRQAFEVINIMRTIR